MTVRLHRTWDPDAGVVAALDLRSGTDSTRITVDSAMALDGDGWLSQTWTVMPTETGPLTLDVAVHLGAEAGERDPLTFDEVVEQHSIDVQPTAWDRLREPLLYLTSIATLAGAVLGSVGLRAKPPPTGRRGRRDRRGPGRPRPNGCTSGRGCSARSPEIRSPAEGRRRN